MVQQGSMARQQRPIFRALLFEWRGSVVIGCVIKWCVFEALVNSVGLIKSFRAIVSEPPIFLKVVFMCQK